MSYRTSSGHLDFDKGDVARMVEHLDRLNAAMRTITELVSKNEPVTAHDFLETVFANELVINAFQPGADWYHRSADDVEIALAQGQITESLAAYYLNCTIIEVRLRMEKAFGDSWRDLADLDLDDQSLAALRRFYRRGRVALLRNISRDTAQVLINAGLIIEVARQAGGVSWYKLVRITPMSRQYIIIKSSRSPRVAQIADAYAGPTAHELGIADKVYQDIKEAVVDADRLTALNPVGFKVWAVGGRHPLYPRDKSESSGS